MDDRVRKIISFRRQEEAGWPSLLAGPERKTRPAFAIGQRRWVNNGKSPSFKLFSSSDANRAWLEFVRRRRSLGLKSAIAEH
jgi:hypothetical protein